MSGGRRGRRFFDDYPIGAGVEDPRRLVDTRAYSPQELRNIEDNTRAGAESIPPIAALYDRINARQIPAQVNYVPRYVLVTVALVPVLLVPKNPRRVSLIISNFLPPAVYDATGAQLKAGGTGLVYSYDRPLSPAAIGAGPLWSGAAFAGIAIQPQGEVVENSGAVSTNDIWVTVNDAAAIFPFPVVCFEGQLSIGGNRR